MNPPQPPETTRSRTASTTAGSTAGSTAGTTASTTAGNTGSTIPGATRWAASPRALLGWRLLLGLLMVTVCALAFDPNPPPQIDTGWDKLNHLLAFGTLAPCTMLALQGRRRRRLGSGLFLLAFGAFIEVVQTQIPGRSGEWGDLLADSLGIVLGLLAARFIDRLLGTG